MNKKEKFKYASFDIKDSKNTIKENLSYDGVCEYLLANKHNLFAKNIFRLHAAESWSCEHFLRYETDIPL